MALPTTHEAFSRYLNTKFWLCDGDAARMEVELVKVSEFVASAGQEGFSVEFLGPLDTRAKQGTYKFEHADMGTFDLFIVPIGQIQDGIIYEAVFNRFSKKD
jgi:hypothetical protein